MASFTNPDWKMIQFVRIKKNGFEVVLIDGKTIPYQCSRKELDKEIEKIEAGCNLVEV